MVRLFLTRDLNEVRDAAVQAGFVLKHTKKPVQQEQEQSTWGRVRGECSSHYKRNQVGPWRRGNYETHRGPRFMLWSSPCEPPANPHKPRAHTFPPNQSGGALYMQSWAYGCECIHSTHSFPRHSLSIWCKPRPLQGGGIHCE